MSVGIVIPTLNEEKNLEKLLPALREYFNGAKIIIVDDQSKDATVDVARSYDCIVLKAYQRRGLGNSYKEGLLTALTLDCEIIVQLDADHPARPAFEMVNTLLAKEDDMIIGIETGSRTLHSKVASWIARNYLGLDFKQPTCGYMVFSAGFLSRLDVSTLKSRGDAFHLELLYKASKMSSKIEEVRFQGVAHEKASYNRVLRWLWELFLMRWRQRKAYKP
jgi:dolichol-phosphate mannosyltransferase